jgi:SAM-dependent methyltransferase
MASLKKLQQNWEELAQADPLWAICSDPTKRGLNWDEKEFFATGETEVGTVLSYVDSLGLSIDYSAPALDFGCGVGRLTRALAARFSECWGVDISCTMIEKAQALNGSFPNCRLVLNEESSLRGFADGHFGFIYSSIVFQHMEPRLVRGYLRELIRVLSPGGVLVFQLADKFKARWARKLRLKLALRRRLRALLGDWRPEFMYCVRETQVRHLIARAGARVCDVKLTNSAEPDFNGNLRFLDRESDEGFVSKQYCIVKNV